MADMTGTTMATWVPTVWSQLATITYRTNVVMPNLCDRRWEPEIGVGRGNTVNIPGFTQNTTATKRTTFGTAATITFDAVTEAQSTLTINQMAYKGFSIPVEKAAQMMPEYLTLLTEGAAMAIMIQVDSDLASDATNGMVGFTATTGTDNVDVTDDDILTTETNISNANGPLADRFAVVSPATRASLMKIDVYRNSLYKGVVGALVGDAGNPPSERGIVMNGEIGSVYSLRFFVMNNLGAGTSGKKNGVFQREAIAFAEQKGVTMLEHLNLAAGGLNQYLAYITYGFKIIKNSYGTQLFGK